MSRFKIIALGLLLAFAFGCDNTTTDKKNTPPTTPVFHEEAPKVCAKFGEEVCIAHKDCTFDTAKKTCADALKKNVCENIQSLKACTIDESCGGWDEARKICLEKEAAVHEEKIVKLFNVDHVGTMGNNQIDALIVSHDQEWAYFVHNDHKSLTAFNIESASKLKDNVNDNNKWHRLSLDTKLSDDQVGRARLTGTTILHQVATPKGALISVSDADNKQGVALLQGKSYVAAWKNDNANNFFGVAMSKTTGEHYVSIFTQVADAFVGTTNNVNINKLNNFADAQVILDLGIERETNAFSSLPFSTPGYLVDNAGIVPVLDDQVGAQVKFAALDHKNIDFGSDSWKFIKSPEKANNAVSSVALAKDKLFIGLKSDNNQGTGGIAVYDPKAEAGKRVTGPHESWDKSSVIALAPDNHGRVWAVTPDALIEVKLSEKSVQQGQKIDADEIQKSLFTGDIEKDKAKAFTFNKEMAFEKITGAQWVGDHLIITSKNGIHVWIYELKVIK